MKKTRSLSINTKKKNNRADLPGNRIVCMNSTPQMNMCFKSMLEFTNCFKVTVHLPINTFLLIRKRVRLKYYISKLNCILSSGPGMYYKGLLAPGFIKTADTCILNEIHEFKITIVLSKRVALITLCILIQISLFLSIYIFLKHKGDSGWIFASVKL